MCIPQSLDPIWGKFDQFFACGQANMGKWANNHDSAQLEV